MLNAVGLFAGIGGIELGLHQAGIETQLLCELEPTAQAVLRHHFPNVALESDIRGIRSIPKVDLVAAGFPCQDLSQAGRTAGISGAQSGLVSEVFRLIDDRSNGPTWLLLENVSFMLRLERGSAMEFLTSALEERGFRWAYRLVDSRAFGVPQRRHRVLLLASRTEDPRPVLFGQDEGAPTDPANPAAFGFYWTEGLRGLGWAVESVPTLKGGSGLGIASPPAVWFPARRSFETPSIEDAERLQGFDAGWTAPAERVAAGRGARRWKLVGNAVTTGVSHWLGEQLLGGHSAVVTPSEPLIPGSAWPNAAWGDHSERRFVQCSMFPVARERVPLSKFLRFPTTTLSARAAAGFLSRARKSQLRFTAGFLEDIEHHVMQLSSKIPAPVG